MKSKEPLPLIYFVVNLQTLQQKADRLRQILKLLRHHFTFELVREEQISEADLIKKVESGHPKLVLVPISVYQSWKKVSAYFGSSHSTQVRYAGYFTEPFQTNELTDPASKSKECILNFLSLNPSEVLLMVNTFTHETRTSGMSPLINHKAPIYCDQWMGYQNLGHRIDQLLSIPEIAKSDWIKRSGAIRILFMSLWSLVYEEGRGRLDIIQQAPSQTQIPLAYFQAGADEQGVWMRLVYSAPHLRTPPEVLSHFWPSQKSHTSPVSLLYKFADFVRVHSLIGTQDIEIVVGLLHTAPSEKAADQTRSFWIEPVTPQSIVERAYELPGPKHPQLKLFPETTSVRNAVSESEELPSDGYQPKQTLPAQLRELKNQLREKDEKIKELRAGGVGTATPSTPPDPEALLDAFQQRYFEARYQIRQCELQIEKMRRGNATATEIHRVKQVIDALLNREKVWIKKLAQVLVVYRKSIHKS